MRVSLGVDRAHPGSGIKDAGWYARLDPQDQTRRAAIYCHPMISAVHFINDNTAGAYLGQKALVEAIAEPGGYTLAGSDLGFFGSGGYGNPAEQVRIGELTEWADEPLPVGNGGSGADYIAVGISAGYMGMANLFGAAPSAADGVAAAVFILPPYDGVAIYNGDLGGARAGYGAAWGVTYPTPLPAGASPKQNTAPWYGKHIRIYYANNDPLNGPAVIADMLAAYGPNAEAIDVGALGHTEAAIAAIDKPNLIRWLHDVAPPL